MICQKNQNYIDFIICKRILLFKKDQRAGHKAEVHTAIIRALKGNGTYEDQSEVLYVI